MRTADPAPSVPIRLAGLVVSLASLVASTSCSTSNSADRTTTTTRPPATSERTTTSTAPTTTDDADDTDDDPGDGVDLTDVRCPDRAAIEELLGGPVERVTALGSSMGDVSYNSKGCTFDRTDEKGSIRIVQLSAESGSDDELYAALEDAAREDSAENGFEPIDGLGDAAYRDGREVAVLDGSHLLFVGFTPEGGDDDPERARKVAEAMIGFDWTDPVECDAVGTELSGGLGGGVETAYGGPGTTVIDDLTISYDQCIVAFADGSEARVGVAPSDQWDAWVDATERSFFTVSFDEVSVGELAAFDDGENLFVDAQPLPWRITTEDLTSSPADQAALRLAAAELAVNG